MADEKKELIANNEATDLDIKTADSAAPKKTDWMGILKDFIKILIACGITGSAVHYANRAPSPEPPPAEIILKDAHGKPHERIELQAVTQGTHVRWRSTNKDLMLIDDLPDLITKKTCIAIAKRPGTYHVECWSAISGEPTWIYRNTVTIDNNPVPPGPTPPEPPPPNPTPPDPPKPPPAPVSPLTQKLQAAYDADSAAKDVKAAQKNNLMILYSAMVEHAKKPDITTTSGLLADMHDVAKTMIPPNALIEMRKIVAAEIAAAVGTDTANLDPAIRPKAVEVFQRLTKCFGEVK